MQRPAGRGLVHVAAILGAGLLAVMIIAAPPVSRTALGQAVGETAEEQIIYASLGATSALGSVSGYSPLTASASEESMLIEPDPVEDVMTDVDFARPHWTSKSVEVHIGPGVGYVVIGQLPRGARLQIVGRDASSHWIALVFSPGSALTGWIEASSLIGELDVSTLEVVPVTLLGR